MPTKPALSFLFANDALYTSGPANTLTNKIVPPDLLQGFVPGDGNSAEHANYLFHHTWNWLNDWLAAGTSVADQDAHVIETDALGDSRISLGRFGGTARTGSAVIVDHNTPGNAPSMLITSSNGDEALEVVAVADSVSAVVIGNSGLAKAMQINDTGTDGGCLELTSNSLSLPVLAVTNIGGASTGVQIVGSASGGDGLSSTADGSGRAGAFVALGTGAALDLSRDSAASTNPGIDLATTGVAVPIRGAIFLDPHLDPSAPLDGDVWKTLGVVSVGSGFLSYYDNNGAAGGGSGGIQRIWSSSKGHAPAMPSVVGAPIDPLTTAAGEVTAATLALDGTTKNEPAGDYLVHYTITLEAGVDPHFFTIKFRNNTSTLQTLPVAVTGGVGRRMTFSTFFRVAYNGTASPNFADIRVENTDGGATNGKVFFAQIVAQGAYE